MGFLKRLFSKPPPDVLEHGIRSAKYLGKKYRNSDVALKIGDNVMVNPVKGHSQSQVPFRATIIEEVYNWQDDGPTKEICTFVDGGHSAVLNDYLFNRLTPIL